LDKTLALPMVCNRAQSIRRHIAYKEQLDYYCIITKTSNAVPQAAHSPVRGMEVLPTNSANRYLFLRDVYRMAGRIISEEKIDALTVQDWRWLGLVGLMLRRRFRLALNLQLHNQVYDNPYRQRESLEAWAGDVIGRLVVPRADTVWVGTRTQQGSLARHGIPPARVYQAYFAVEAEPFYHGDAATARAEMGVTEETHVVLWVGRMTKQKDLGTLLHAFRGSLDSCPGAILVLLGDGPERTGLEAIAHRLGIQERVRFAGHVAYEHVPDYYAASDVVCISSLYEGTCRTIHEAMASARPVVSTDVAGALDAVQEGQTGHIVPRRSPEPMAQALTRLLQDRDLSRKMGTVGREYHGKYLTMDRHCAVFVEMWEATKEITQQMREPA
jgi:glycosyltransferase involved in cell wall biosynthesis